MIEVAKCQAICFLVVLSCLSSQGAARVQNTSREARVEGEDINALVEQLKSDRHEEAKAEIRNLGKEAAPYLMTFLNGLTEHMYEAHFETGRENEGREFIRDPISNSRFGKYEITMRLMSDTEELLAEIDPDEAIPVILRILETRMSFSQEKYWPETGALVKAGGKAVPALTDALTNADTIAARLAPPSASPRARSRVAMAIRLRVVLALGDIGDPRALPALESQLSPQGAFAGETAGVVNEAINKIRSRMPK